MGDPNARLLEILERDISRGDQAGGWRTWTRKAPFVIGFAGGPLGYRQGRCPQFTTALLASDVYEQTARPISGVVSI